MLTRVLAKNTPLLLRRSFPLNEAGSKTGTGTLSVTATTTTAPQGTLNPAVQNRVPAILRPLMPRGPQLLFNPGGRVSSGPQTGDGTLAVTATLSTSAGRSFNDIGTTDTLSVGVTLTGTAPTGPGVNWTGTGSASSTHTMVASGTIKYNGTGTLAALVEATGGGTLMPAASGDGTGTLSVTSSLSASPVIARNGTSSLAAEFSITGAAVYKRAVASTLSVTATITCSASTTAKWNNKPRNSGTWTNIART